MRVLVERVLSANLETKGHNVKIDQGLLVYVGFTHEDTPEAIKNMTKKLLKLRVFSDEEGKMNLSLLDIKGSLLSVPAFTLQATLKKGHRPSFENALAFDQASLYYDLFNDSLRDLIPLKTGVFGSDMTITAINDGPITMVLEG